MKRKSDDINHPAFIERAFEIFKNRNLSQSPIEKADALVAPFLQIEGRSNRNALRMARRGRLISLHAASLKAGVSKSTWIAAEASESSGSIQIATLERLAEAIDCELIYGIRPKERKLFSNLIWEKLFAQFKDHKYRPWENGNQSKAFRLAGLVHWKWNDPKFRRSQRWMRNQFPATRDKSGRK